MLPKKLSTPQQDSSQVLGQSSRLVLGLDRTVLTWVTLPVVRDAYTLRGVTVSWRSRWSSDSGSTLAPWWATRSCCACGTRGSYLRLPWWPWEKKAGRGGVRKRPSPLGFHWMWKGKTDFEHCNLNIWTV